MKKSSTVSKSFIFRWRKIVHYSLIISILLIQLLIAAYFYYEFKNKQNLTFIQNQLSDVRVLENLTDNTEKELFNAQDFLQKYTLTNDKASLDEYFRSVNALSKNLDSINHFAAKKPGLKNTFNFPEKKLAPVKQLKKMIDSTYQYSTKSNYQILNDISQIKKFDFHYDFDVPEVQIKKYSDTIKKKGILGRIGDAIAGKNNIQKDSTVITVKSGKIYNPKKLKTELDSVMNAVNNHYYVEVKKIQINDNNVKAQNTANSDKFYKLFSNLLNYSNGLMQIYEEAVKKSKSKLENEIAEQDSQTNKIRKYLVIILLSLMFLVSILIMYFTRMAFIYEQKLKSANIQIKENLNFKNRILGMLSHELRSPLKIIGIFINKINAKTEDKTVKEYLKSISFTNNTLLIQANQILEYTKNQQFENKLTPTVFNIKNEIHSILTAIKPYVETRNNKFVIDENVADVLVFSDCTKINQIFVNILGNANKFTENGQISVSSKSENLDENKISLITTISDTGVGISKSDLKKIFEPYYQGQISSKLENLGAGLGLSLCKEIIELYDGKIKVESEVNQGTTIHFQINLDIKK